MMTNWTLLSSFILIFILLLTIPIIVAALIKKQSEKTSLFECGLSNCDSPRHPFSLRFFLLMILFIIFDIEITILLASPMAKMVNPSVNVLMLFISILLAGVFYEWFDGSLNWKK